MSSEFDHMGVEHQPRRVTAKERRRRRTGRALFSLCALTASAMAIPVSPAAADGDVCNAGLVVLVVLGQCESVQNGPGTVIAQQQQQQAAGGGGGGGGSSSSSGSSSSGSGGSGAGGPEAQGTNATPRQATAPPARIVMAARPSPEASPTLQPLGEGDVEKASRGEAREASLDSATPTSVGDSGGPAGGTPTDAVPASGQAPDTAASGPVVNSADPAGSAVLADGGLLRQTGILPAAMLSIAGVVFFLSGRRAALARKHNE